MWVSREVPHAQHQRDQHYPGKYGALPGRPGHVDWPSLLAAIDATGASRVWVTHGYSGVVVRWLRERGLDAHVIETRFEGERDDDA